MSLCLFLFYDFETRIIVGVECNQIFCHAENEIAHSKVTSHHLSAENKRLVGFFPDLNGDVLGSILVRVASFFLSGKFPFDQILAFDADIIALGHIAEHTYIHTRIGCRIAVAFIVGCRS